MRGLGGEGEAAGGRPQSHSPQQPHGPRPSCNKPNLTKPVSSVTPPPCPSYSGRKGRWAFQSKPDVAQRHGPDLNPNRGGGASDGAVGSHMPAATHAVPPQVVPCEPQEFAPDNVTCQRCPAGAQCNGTEAIAAQPNFWRTGAVAPDGAYTANTAEHRFIECDMATCGGGTDAGCTAGATGLVCGSCGDGYGGWGGVEDRTCAVHWWRLSCLAGYTFVPRTRRAPSPGSMFSFSA